MPLRVPASGCLRRQTCLAPAHLPHCGTRSTALPILLVFAAGLAAAQIPTQAAAQTAALAAPASAAHPDVLTFTNGDRLTGKLVRVFEGKVTFHSEVVGDVTVPWSKVKTLNAEGQYALVEKEQRLTRKSAATVPLGTVDVRDNVVQIAPASGTSRSYPTSDRDYLIDAHSLNREIRGESNLLYGWTGNITLGASVVQATDNNQTYTGAIGVTRSIPTVNWLPAESRATLNLSGTYGLSTQPEILVSGTVIQGASVGKTNILHGDTEYDRYLSPRFFLLANASADHNFGSGLQLQQTYGLGFGWTLVQSPKRSLDLKVDLHYEQQQFYNGILSGLGTPNENLVGGDLTEIWTRTFIHGIRFNQSLTVTPAFNVFQASSAAASASLVFPVYKKLNFNLSSTDNYLGDPPVGYRRNSLQFAAGVTYFIR